jgi:hypothetical protein
MTCSINRTFDETVLRKDLVLVENDAQKEAK